MVETRSRTDNFDNSKFINVQVKKTKKLIIFFEVLFLLIAVIFFVAGLKENGEDQMFDFVFAGMMLLFVILYIPIVKVISKKLQKNSNGTSYAFQNNAEIYFKFEDDKFYMEVSCADLKETVEAKYNYFYQVIEEGDHLFFFVQKQALSAAISKQDVVSGTYEELKEILNKNLGSQKFIQSKKINIQNVEK
jgi:K+ transporter